MEVLQGEEQRHIRHTCLPCLPPVPRRHCVAMAFALSRHALWVSVRAAATIRLPLSPPPKAGAATGNDPWPLDALPFSRCSAGR